MTSSRATDSPEVVDPPSFPAPDWLAEVLGAPVPPEGEAATIGGRRFVRLRGILREEPELFGDQAQSWMVEKYGDVAHASWWDEYGAEPLVVDAGCGAALSALELFGPKLPDVRYLGVDVSDAVDAAATRFRGRNLDAAFLQVDLARAPLREGSVDVLFSAGVLHHTDSTELAIKQLARLLKPQGRFLFYVYRAKGPVHEFTDDYVRDRLEGLTPDQAWDALMPLSQLGKALGDLGVEVDVPEEVALLGIPAGRIDVQRLFYWYFCKAFHHPDFTLDELNHINYDWYAPRNAHHQTPEQVRAWCAEAQLDVEREHLQESGITIVARKRAR